MPAATGAPLSDTIPVAAPPPVVNTVARSTSAAGFVHAVVVVDRSKHAETIQAAVKTVDDPDLVCVDSTGWITEDDCTDLVHPTVAGHAKIAAHLVEALEQHTSLRRPAAQ